MGLCCSNPQDSLCRQKSSHSVPNLVNEEIITVNGIKLNSLGYALYYGNFYCFKYFIEDQGADPKTMEDLLWNSGNTGLGIICEKGYLQFLKYYLTIHNEKEYVQRLAKQRCAKDEFSCFTDFQLQSQDDRIRLPKTPIQTAAEKGFVKIVKFIAKFYGNKTPPCYLDINYQDEITGENCALIAVKTANLELIKFLHKKTKAEFQALNKRSEGALQIAAVWSKKLIHLPYQEVIKYLIEEVGLDPCFAHEETLLICENTRIIQYLVKVLKSRGISADKFKLEKENYIQKGMRQRNQLEVKLDIYDGGNFNFIEIFNKYAESEQDLSSFASSIHSLDNTSNSSAASMLSFFSLISYN